VIHDFARDIDVFRAMEKQGIALDPEALRRAHEELTEYIATLNQWFKKAGQKQLSELNQMIQNAQQNPSSRPRSEFQQSLTQGFFFLDNQAVESSVFAESTLPGKTLHIINLYSGLSFHDTHVMQEVSEEICLATGDQSLTEAISLGKMLMYDRRKVEPVIALWELATQKQLHLASKFFRSFAENKINVVVACLLRKSQLRKEINKLFAVIYREMDFAPELIALVNRKLYQGQTDREDQIHRLFQDYFVRPQAQEDIFCILKLIEQIQAAT
jgi:hypothetical protein